MTRLVLIALGLVGSLMASGCKRQADFDERYEDASQKIEDAAKAIDARIQATGSPEATEDANRRAG